MFGIFKKKKTPVKKSNTLYNSDMYSLSTFGTTIVNWNNVYKDSQNNLKLIQQYNNLAEISAPINKFADAFSLILPIIKQNGKEVKNHWLKSLLEKPNDLQNWSAFISQLAIYYKLLGNAYITGNNTSDAINRTNKLTSLYNLPSQNINIELKNNEQKDFRLIEILNYIFTHNNKAIKIPAEKVLHIKATNPNFKNNQFLYGLSNLVSVNKNIESIESGYSAKVNLYKKGARVIVTGKSQGEFGSVNTSETIKEVQEKFNNNYGLTEGQYQMLITDIPLDVKVISHNIAQLKINENNLADFQRICGVLDVPSILISDNDNSSYENVKEAKEHFYNVPFKNLVEDVFLDLTEYFKRFDKSIEVVPDFSKVSEIVKKQNESYAKVFEDVKLGLVTRNDYFELIGKDRVKIKEFDEYYFYNNGWFSVENKENEKENTE